MPRLEGLFLLGMLAVTLLIAHGRALEGNVSSVAYDYTNLRAVVTRVLSADNLALSRLKCDAVNITMPSRGIMVTYANQPSLVLVKLQFKAMDIWTPGLRDCLDTKYVVLCTDAEAYDECKLSGFLNCALVVVPSLGVYSPQFSAGFYAFSFFKYEVIIESLALAEEMFFFDADILMFKTPWFDDNGIYKFDEQGNRVTPSYEFMYQREHAYNFDCHADDVNGGQYYIRNTTSSQLFLRTMLTYREKILSYGEGKFDQDYVGEALVRSGTKSCGLNPYRFASGWQAYGFKANDHLNVISLVTFHFDSLNGNKGQSRINRMKTMLERIKDKPGMVLNQLFSKAEYFSSSS